MIVPVSEMREAAGLLYGISGAGEHAYKFSQLSKKTGLIKTRRHNYGSLLVRGDLHHTFFAHDDAKYHLTHCLNPNALQITATGQYDTLPHRDACVVLLFDAVREPSSDTHWIRIAKPSPVG